MEMYPFQLTPIYDPTIWAGQRLRHYRSDAPAGCGTSWEVSVHPHAESVIANGPFAGLLLKDVMEQYPREVLGSECTMNDLVRLAFLDAGDSLSVQVHPDEAYAELHEHDHGKTEAWYILEAAPGASLVAGTDLDTKEELRQAIEDGTIMRHLRHVPVQRGDFICIEAGTLHALGAGILAIEIGTNSNVTYRFYDYDRRDAEGHGRTLHLKQSFDVVRMDQKADAIHTPYEHPETDKILLERPEFCVHLHDVSGVKAFENDGKSYRILSNMGNSAEIFFHEKTISFKAADSVFLPAECGKIEVRGSTRILESNVSKAKIV